MLHLDTLKAGEKARVLGFTQGEPAYRHKLMAMGLTRGQIITVVRVAPLGDPVQIEVRGSALSIRKHEATRLVLEKLTPDVVA